MKKLLFKPRLSFNADLKRLAIIDVNLIDEVRSAIDILLEDRQLPKEFNDHALVRRMAGYREFHLRDTPQNQQADESNDILVIYRIDEDELILIGVRVGSHQRLFADQNKSKK